MNYLFRIGIPLCLSISVTFGQQKYTDYSSQVSRMQELERGHRNLVSLKELATTPGNNKVYVITLSNGNDAAKPAIAVVGGISGAHLTGSEMALRFARDVLSNDSLRGTLDKVTYYVFPNMSPDAMSQYFAKPSWAREGNASETDDDRDGRINEDGPDDLDKDGVITWMRIKDPAGEWIISPEDNRAMKKADQSKGEKGQYRLYSEGIDNDGDGSFNEDGPGGVAFNRNFTYQYPWFQAGAGEYQVSEPENRAMLDFLYEKTNIFLVMSFGPGNNLTSPMVYNAQQANKRVVSSVLKDDGELNKWISDEYKKITKAPERALSASGGDFLQWAYFHYGRQSYSTPAFFIPDMKKKGEKSIDDQLRDLRWADSLKADAVRPWTKVQVASLQGSEVEIGGINPFFAQNAPLSMLDSLSGSHTRFITSLASKKPSVALVNQKVEDLGKGVFRVSITLINDGQMPALTQMGQRVKWVQKPKVTLKLASGMSLSSGNLITLIDKLDAGQSIELSWLIQGKGSLALEAGSPQTGTKTLTIDVR